MRNLHLWSRAVRTFAGYRPKTIKIPESRFRSFLDTTHTCLDGSISSQSYFSKYILYIILGFQWFWTL